jgi:hypothetical protein
MLSIEEIAEAMFVSVNTVRTHVRSILAGRALDATCGLVLEEADLTAGRTPAAMQRPPNAQAPVASHSPRKPAPAKPGGVIRRDS